MTVTTDPSIRGSRQPGGKPSGVLLCLLLGLLCFGAGCSEDDVVIHDTLDDLNRTENLDFEVSGRSRKTAGRFVIDKRMRITELSWSGFQDTLGLVPEEIFEDGKSRFFIEIFWENSGPIISNEPYYQHDVWAEGQVTGDREFFEGQYRSAAHIYSCMAPSDIVLEPGIWWISIYGDKTLFWSVERGRYDSEEGHGGAAYHAGEDYWYPLSENQPLDQARGPGFLLMGHEEPDEENTDFPGFNFP